ncbi:nucleotidyltransferase family protein [Patescibacteria group bacterium]|nr:nucleotidyltransferase family protein [Patescibacteria group bacterium]
MKKTRLSNYDLHSTRVELRSMKAVILAGGAGSRLYPITKELPKPLLPIKRKPILNHLVDLFHSYGIKKIAILINRDFREDFDWWKKRYYPKEKIKIFEEKKPLGTFGGLFYLKDWLSKGSPSGEPAEPFFFTNGDELKKIKLFEMKNFHQKKKTPATIALVKVPNPQDYGVVICKNGLVQEFLEKPSPAQILKKTWAGKKSTTQYISSGLYLLSPEIFNYHPGPKFSMIEKDLFPKLAKEKKLTGFKFNGKWMDTGTFERYETAIRKWK